LYLTKLNLL